MESNYFNLTVKNSGTETKLGLNSFSLIYYRKMLVELYCFNIFTLVQNYFQNM